MSGGVVCFISGVLVLGKPRLDQRKVRLRCASR